MLKFEDFLTNKTMIIHLQGVEIKVVGKVVDRNELILR